ncbi:hypothetical protein [Acinetobacter higginsii]|uniref:hypothetical protein n=1 Tax=Acinetobacter higginsii TaxID=70347 RepID=UPI001F6037DC|nr:hypothetical protein [Acinetobacter higginsii]MCI3877553.1 hypothetical protein [Acinetobacter higginsii]
MGCKCQSIHVIRGDTFSYLCHFDNNHDEAIDLTNVTFEAVLDNSSHTWQQPLSVKKVDQIAHRGDFLLSAENTENWLVGNLQIKLTRIIGSVRSSTLIPILVSRG